MTWAIAMVLSMISPLLFAAVTFAAPILVDCTRPTTDLQRRIPVGTRPVELVVKGTCTENLVITRDDVTITSHATTPGAIVAADPDQDAVKIDGGRRIVIDGLTIAGGVRAVAATRGASLDIKNCVVTGAGVIGIVSLLGSSVNVADCAVQQNGSEGVTTANNASVFMTGGSVTDNGRHGIVGIRSAHIGITAVNISSNGGTGIIVADSSVGVIVKNVISQNVNGIVVQQGSSSRIGIDAAGVSTANGNTIASNTGRGILVESSTVTAAGNTVTGNGMNGIEITRAGLADVQSSFIDSNTGHGILAVTNSTVRLRNGTKVRTNTQSGIRLERHSILELLGLTSPPVTEVSGNTSFGLQCLGNSQYLNETADATVFSGNNGGGQQVSCPPF